jgi:cytochrome c biogenesis protein CcmG/thiol:disulfide interchange protein DsbE
MRGKRRLISLLVAVAALTAFVVIVVVTATRATPTIAKGQPVPNIRGTTLDGQPFDLAALRGRPVFINFWASWCVPCRSEFPLLSAMAQEHSRDGLVIVGVLSDDDPEAARTFVAQYHASWQTVIDSDGSMKLAYQVAAQPQSYFVDKAGILRSIQIGEIIQADFERQFRLISGGS